MLGSCGGCETRWDHDTAAAHCSRCHVTFRSVTGFDDHRTGANPALRRCMTEPEMRDAGLAPNDAGHWRTPRPDETLPDRSEA